MAGPSILNLTFGCIFILIFVRCATLLRPTPPAPPHDSRGTCPCTRPRGSCSFTFSCTRTDTCGCPLFRPHTDDAVATDNRTLTVQVESTLVDFFPPTPAVRQCIPPPGWQGCAYRVGGADTLPRHAHMHNIVGLRSRWPVPVTPGSIGVLFAAESRAKHWNPAEADRRASLPLLVSYEPFADVPFSYFGAVHAATTADQLSGWSDRRLDELLAAKRGTVAYVSRVCRPHRAALVAGLLARNVSVHSMGRCEHNHDEPRLDSSVAGGDLWRQLMPVYRDYKFVVAMEGAADEHMVSEKFFNPLQAGAVPIVWGAPRATYEAHAPSPSSFLHLDDDFGGDFGRLADHLRHLDRNNDAYRALHTWRLAPPSEQLVHQFQTNPATLPCRVCHAVAHALAQ